MKKYRLKKGQEAFQIVDGPDARMKFEKGRTYTKIPKAEARRFEEVKPDAAVKTAGTTPAAKTDKKE